jgi:uncharacterized protein (DUF924 family)/TolB-like protein
VADVFISYSRKDVARIAPLVAAIEAAGWSVWWDTEIAPGQDFDSLIGAELALAKAVVVVWTPQSVGSRWVRGEARDAADRGLLVPVRFEGASLPIDARALHTIDLDEPTVGGHEPQIQAMLRAIGSLIGASASSQASPKAHEPDRLATDAEPARLAICVLPFANLSGDPEQQHFSDGITEDIITELSRWRILSVRSRSASFRYRGAAVDVKQVARELAVRFIVEGSVRRLGERIRVSAQLTDTETGSQLWGEKFDRNASEIFTVQDQLVRTIVGTLVGRVQVSDAKRADRRPPTSLAAYECVLKGNALPWSDPAGLAEAQRLFEKAIELDPGYGFAHALLAAISYDKWRNDPSESDADLDTAYALAKKAVELDPNESTCYAMLAQVCALRRSFDLALQYSQRAVELNPGNQWNSGDLAMIYVGLGQPEDALTWFKRAREIDPYFDPPWYFRGIGMAYMSQGRYGDASATFEQIPGRHYRILALQAACYARMGETDRTQSAATECLTMRPDFAIDWFVRKQVFKSPSDAANLTESLRLAGFPQTLRPEPAWIDEVLRFWFEELTEDDWYSKRADVDAWIHDRFRSLHQELAANQGLDADGPRALLACVIVLDQFSRHLFRDDPRAFAADPIARQLASRAIECGFDKSLSKSERAFLYLPFEHSENKADQARSLDLMQSLDDDGLTHYAVMHKAIIDRFGRFPHRNAILGRASTAEELEFLSDPANSF